MGLLQKDFQKAADYVLRKNEELSVISAKGVVKLNACTATISIRSHLTQSSQRQAKTKSTSDNGVQLPKSS